MRLYNFDTVHTSFPNFCAKCPLPSSDCWRALISVHIGKRRGSHHGSSIASRKAIKRSTRKRQWRRRHWVGRCYDTQADRDRTTDTDGYTAAVRIQAPGRTKKRVLEIETVT